ncbi:MAG: cache domain-containing protein, partial [Inquilinus sp.]|nr:cache domain-containing protein [Inquilinus sp.]
MGALVLLGVATVLLIGLTTSRRNTLDLLNQQSELIAAAIETAVENHIDPAIDLADFVARLVESGALDLSDQDRVMDVLTGALAGTPQVGAILTWNPEFRTLGVYNDIDRNIGPILEDFPNSPDILRMLEVMAEVPGLVFGDLMYVEGNTYVNLGRALRRDGELLGYLGTGVTLQELSRLVTDVSDLFDTTAFILHGRDR